MILRSHGYVYVFPKRWDIKQKLFALKLIADTPYLDPAMLDPYYTLGGN